MIKKAKMAKIINNWKKHGLSLSRDRITEKRMKMKKKVLQKKQEN